MDPMVTARSRRGVTLVEMMVALIIGTLVISIAWSLYRFNRVSVEGTLAPQMGLQTTSRKALVQFIREVQESVEVAKPLQGTTLDYMIARDKLNRILVIYPAKNNAASTAAGRNIYDLYLYRHDYGTTPPVQAQRRMIEGLERVAFTTLSPGVVQIHLQLHEAGKSYTLLTAVRTRNILMEGKL